MFGRWFGRKQESAPSLLSTGLSGAKVVRHSGGWAALRKRLLVEQGLRVVDVGFTSSANINYLTSLGHSVFLADPVNDASSEEWHAGRNEKDQPIWDIEGFLDHSFQFSGRMFDIVLLWTALDYLPEPLLAPMVAHLHRVMNSGGQVLAFFHTRTQGADTAYCRYHVTDGEDVEAQTAQPFPIQRAFSNRSIEKLFAGWVGHRQFLAKDSVSEVIMTR